MSMGAETQISCRNENQRVFTLAVITYPVGPKS